MGMPLQHTIAPDAEHQLVHWLMEVLGGKTVLVMLALGALVMGSHCYRKWLARKP